jgi:ubiquinone biosynthesis protein
VILQAYAVMIFQSDRFHADPHPGNLIALKGGRLGLIDFGEVGSVEPSQRSALLAMMTAVFGRDGNALAGAVLSVSRTTRPVSRADFGTQLATLLHPVADASLKDVRLGDVLRPLLHLLRGQGIVLPSDLATLIKTMIECEATTNELDPTLSMLDLVGERDTKRAGRGCLPPLPKPLPSSLRAARLDQTHKVTPEPRQTALDGLSGGASWRGPRPR